MMERRVILWIFCAMACLAGILFAGEEPNVPCDLYLIVDTSPLTRHTSAEMRAVGEASVRALKPGDRLRIVAAHPSRVRVLLLEEIGVDKSRRKELLSIFDEIRPATFFPADLGKSLEVPLAALQDKANVRLNPVLVVLLTDGRLSSRRVASTLAAAGKLQEMGARVVITGTEATSQELLRAAAEGRVRWHALSKCDPSQWIADARRSMAVTSKPAENQSAVKEPEANRKPPEAPAPKAPEVKIAPPSIPPKVDAGTAPKTHSGQGRGSEAPPKSASASPGTAATAAVRPAEAKEVRPMAPPAPPPLTLPAAKSGPRPLAPAPPPQASTSPPLNLQVAGILRIEGAGRSDQKAAKTSTGEPRPAAPSPPSKAEPPSLKHPATFQEPCAQPPRPLKPGSSAPATRSTATRVVAQVMSPETQSQPPVSDVAAPAHATSPASTRRSVWRSVLAAGLIILMLTGAGLLAPDAIRVLRRRARRAGSQLPTGNEATVSQLVVAANGAEHVLGPPELLGSVRVGSEATNAVIVNGEGVAGHHVEISRRGRRWRIRNLSSAPVEVNGLELPGRRKLFVPLPAVIKLSSYAHLRVFLRSSGNGGNRKDPTPANQEHQR